jgi:hypothetical protein
MSQEVVEKKAQPLTDLTEMQKDFVSILSSMKVELLIKMLPCMLDTAHNELE